MVLMKLVLWTGGHSPKELFSCDSSRCSKYLLKYNNASFELNTNHSRFVYAGSTKFASFDESDVAMIII